MTDHFFEFMNYLFMKNAMLAVLTVTPAFGMLGTMIVSSRMIFFSDVIGHSSLTGIGIGIILGLSDPTPAMIVFAIFLAIAINFFRDSTKASSETIIGVFFALSSALGIAILSAGGNFNRFTGFLIGDILVITDTQILQLAALLAMLFIYWILFSNRLIIISLSPVLAKSRGTNTFLAEIMFTIIIAATVTLSIRWIGILIINSLLILPAAGARILAKSMRQYVVYSVLISMSAGIAGLIISFYIGTSAGATIVLVAGTEYILCYIISKLR